MSRKLVPRAVYFVICLDVGSWRGGLTSVTLWALLTAAAALEVYDDVPDVDTAYQDDNILDTGPVLFDSGDPDLALAKDMLLYRLINTLNKPWEQDGSHRSKYRPHWISNHAEPRHQLNDRREKEEEVNRLSDTLRGSWIDTGFNFFDNFYRPQQKRKIKKGIRRVCLMKLCPFRSPH